MVFSSFIILLSSFIIFKFYYFISLYQETGAVHDQGILQVEALVRINLSVFKCIYFADFYHHPVALLLYFRADISQTILMLLWI